MCIGYATVQILWPTLREIEWVQNLPENVATYFALFSAGFLFVVITHMQRGHLDPYGYWFASLYALACTGFALSTVPHSQHNTGTASFEIGFIIMLFTNMFGKWWKERKQPPKGEPMGT